MMKFIILMTITIILILYYWTIFEPFEQKLSDDKKIKLVDMMKFVHDLFIKENIWYIISFGTLLGAVRHWGLIPWDDDIDLLIKIQDVKKFEQLIPIIEKKGYIVEKQWKLYRIYEQSHELFIDLFVIDVENEKIVRCQTDNQQCLYPDKKTDWWWRWFNFPAKLIEKKTMFSFEGIKLYGPTSANELLKFWYGHDYLTVCKTPYLSNHETYIEQKVTNCPVLPIPQL